VRSWSSGGRLKRAVAAISVLSVVSLAFMGIASVNVRGGAQDASHMRISTGSDAARSKVHPDLLRAMTSTPQAAVMVHAYVKAGTDLRRYMPDAIANKFVDPAGNTFVTGTLRASNLLKTAALSGVVAIVPMTGDYAPALDPQMTASGAFQPTGDLAAKLTAHVQSGVRTNNGRGNDIAPTGWADVLNTHQSSLAWDKGYTGTGVKVMVNDTGSDYANPDLIDTWAVVSDPSSPYYGWPEQFDQISMYLFARDYFLGEANVANGAADYVDTSHTVTTDAADYQPLDAADAYSYTLPGTSKSGTYHIGTHPDNGLRTWYRIANGLDLTDPSIADERPAVLVADEHTAGVYDTVYVDLDFDHDFTNEKAITRDDPISGADWWGPFDSATGDFSPQPDGLYDESGGLVYWIADGSNPPPAADWDWGIGAAGNGQHDDGEPGAGNMVAFAVNDITELAGGIFDAGHGTLCASNVLGQGRIDNDPYQWAILGDESFGFRPSYKPAGTQGMVVGAGKNAKLVTAGNFYQYGGYDAFLFAALGYDGAPGTSDDVQIMSNSWGHTREIADGWDFDSRIIDFYNRNVNPNLLITFSAGNEGPGFGSLSGPEPVSALTVGASTQWGSTGMDSAASADQIIYGDAAWFTSRGPSATGTAAIDVMADGQRASGDLPINGVLSGAHAWSTWGGTSRSSPVAAGNAALMEQAYKKAHGHWPDYETAKSILMSSSRDINFDPFTQGAGTVNANRAVDLADGTAGGYVWPSSWSAGDYRGFNFPGFANIMTPGQSSEGQFTITNSSSQELTYAVSDRWLQHESSWETTWTSNPIDEEPITVVPDNPGATDFDWNMPQYLWNITDLIPDDTDVMIARYNFDYGAIDPTFSYDAGQAQDWQLLVYDWTDVNGDGNLWTDDNGNGVADPGEVDQGEYVRYDYSRPFANSAEMTIQRPQDRHHDGLFMSLQHRQARTDVPQTTFLLGLDFYHNVDFPWLSENDSITVAAGDTQSIKATVQVPGDAPPGEYEGDLLFNDGYWTSVVPVTVNVAARTYNVEGGGEPAASYYDNSAVRGAQDWSSSYVQGDYRQFFVDLGDNPAGLGDRLESGTQYLIVDAQWEQLPTDINIHVLGPVADQFSNDPDSGQPEYYGPYTLAEIAKSNDGYVGGGAFFPDTTSGASREVIAAPYDPGLNDIVLHNVTYDGSAAWEHYAVRAGALAVSESPINVSRPAGNPDFHVDETVISTLPLSGLVVQGFGLSKPDVQNGVPIQQDDPNDPFTASYTKEIHLDHAGLLDIQTALQAQDDVDIYLVYDANGDGQFDPTEVIAASTNPAGTNESISVTLPADGDYLLLAHGWAIPSGNSTFDLSVNAVQGDDISASGLPTGEVVSGQRYTFSLDMSGAGHDPGTYTGLVTLGPPEGPAAVLIPVTFEIRGE